MGIWAVEDEERARGQLGELCLFEISDGVVREESGYSGREETHVISAGYD